MPCRPGGFDAELLEKWRRGFEDRVPDVQHGAKNPVHLPVDEDHEMAYAGQLLINHPERNAWVLALPVGVKTDLAMHHERVDGEDNGEGKLVRAPGDRVGESGGDMLLEGEPGPETGALEGDVAPVMAHLCNPRPLVERLVSFSAAWFLMQSDPIALYDRGLMQEYLGKDLGRKFCNRRTLGVQSQLELNDVVVMICYLLPNLLLVTTY